MSWNHFWLWKHAWFSGLIMLSNYIHLRMRECVLQWLLHVQRVTVGTDTHRQPYPSLALVKWKK